MVIETFGEFLQKENEIISRIQAIPNGYYMFLAHPFMMLETIGVDLGENAKKKIREIHPAIDRNVDVQLFTTLKKTSTKQPVQVKMKHLFRPDVEETSSPSRASPVKPAVPVRETLARSPPIAPRKDQRTRVPSNAPPIISRTSRGITPRATVPLKEQPRRTSSKPSKPIPSRLVEPTRTSITKIPANSTTTQPGRAGPAIMNKPPAGMKHTAFQNQGGEPKTAPSRLNISRIFMRRRDKKEEER